MALGDGVRLGLDTWIHHAGPHPQSEADGAGEQLSEEEEEEEEEDEEEEEEEDDEDDDDEDEESGNTSDRVRPWWGRGHQGWSGVLQS